MDAEKRRKDHLRIQGEASDVRVADLRAEVEQLKAALASSENARDRACEAQDTISDNYDRLRAKLDKLRDAAKAANSTQGTWDDVARLSAAIKESE